MHRAATRMLNAVPDLPEEFAERVLYEHPNWRLGMVPMGRVKLALRLYAMSE